MAEPVTVKIQGLDELQRRLESVEERVAKKGIRKALGAAGRIIKNAVVAASPKRTGFLSKHFGVRFRLSREERAGTVFIGPEGKIDYPKSQEILENVMHMTHGQANKVLKNTKGRISVASVVRFFEFGTSKMAKKPFMTQAGAAVGRDAVDAAVQELKNAVEGTGT